MYSYLAIVDTVYVQKKKRKTVLSFIFELLVVNKNYIKSKLHQKKKQRLSKLTTSIFFHSVTI